MAEPMEVEVAPGVNKKILRAGVDTPAATADVFDTADVSPPSGSKVTVHYVGRLLDGTVFDSSRERNDPFVFDLGKGRVIKAWDVGVASMKRGELAELTCAPEMAYGASGSPPKIPPNATLVFEVELLSWSSGDDISGKNDGSLVKKIAKEGANWKKPKNGEDVQFRIRVRNAASGETYVDHTQQAVWQRIGDVSVYPAAVSTALTNMKLGEHALVRATDAGSDAIGVPANTPVVFDLVLERWIEVVKITDDEGVVKRILGEGEGFKTAKDGSTAKVRILQLADPHPAFADLISQHPDGQGSEVTVVVGDVAGQLPEAVEMALETMKVNERAVVTVHPSFHSLATSAIYDVKLLSFTPVKDIWDMSDAEKVETANVTKEKGSTLFRESKFRAAEKKYLAALKLVESDFSFTEEQKAAVSKLRVASNSNLAAVQLKGSKWAEAIKSASKVLEIEPNNVKALFRRAQAEHRSGDLELALADLAAASKLEPSDAAIRAETTAVQNKVQAQKNKEKALYSKMFA
ncbi:FK506-binding protein [Capsaspora owczarzaki ATCC 30864]|uniref:peptidylprolyl isomerase n=1 Tax=Capsaspora owczarzaki (strain ATCC 30864) TaxID=595528 RepID=A0A0D2X0M5_CAPO3|nr:FK506-binding protein [Capsaspora owczarzaki ATCC 30864]KJE89319.1 FK506-binding protein [Capsaspora owczarzaki ATCC 30864]|eukprot:XP_004365685.1 FK506-binding protein [Capsaspora owczarzaki ATCC 30864]